MPDGQGNRGAGNRFLPSEIAPRTAWHARETFPRVQYDAMSFAADPVSPGAPGGAGIVYNITALPVSANRNGKLFEKNQRSFNVASASSAQTPAMIQNRTTIWVSVQPSRSKWWWIGVQRNTLRPVVRKEAT